MEEPAAPKTRRDRAAHRLHDLTGGLCLPAIDWDSQLAPLTLLPTQVRTAPELCGCQRLLLAVLCDAFRRLASPPPGRPDLHHASRSEVLSWFEQPDANVTINLRDVCDGLGINVERAQAAAARMA